MAEPTDHELLGEFARTGTERAFAALVARHINLVYSAARRFTSDDTLAEEISQAVFILLARKAGGISSRVVLSGWLYQAARLTAANALKEKLRRQKREQEACMQSNLITTQTDDAWKQLAPALDDAMGALREADRNAVLLRYFENKPLAEVGTALGVSEDAARVRINRAIDKLRQLLAKKGVTLGATAITGAVAANAVQAVPAALALSITTAAITGTVTTTLLSTTPMNWIILKAIAVSLAAALTAGTITYVVAHREVTQLQVANDSLKQQVNTLGQQRDEATASIAGLRGEIEQIKQDKSELLKLRGEVGGLRQQLGQVKNENARLKANLPIAQPLQPRTQVGSASTETSALNHCINNLRQIDAAMQQCALEHRLSATNTVTGDDILPYLMGNKLPECPAGGTYTFGRLDQSPTCSIPGHALPETVGSPAAEMETGQFVEAIMRDLPQRPSSAELREAAASYARDHNGTQPRGINQFLFYLKQPGPKMTAALDAYKQSHNNSMPTNVVELAPYFN